MPVDKFGRMSDAKTKDTGVSLTYINNNYIRSDGGTPVTGSIDMNGNTLHNVATPVNPHDVATKDYTDNKRTHIISVKGSYFGLLKKGRYQFNFGADNYKFDKDTIVSKDESPYTSSFLIPHSGRIKKIAVKLEEITYLPFIPSSLFSFIIIKNNENTETRLTDYIFRKKYGVPLTEEEIERKKIFYDNLIENEEEINWTPDAYLPQTAEYFFDNDIENYPVAEGDLMTVKTLVNSITNSFVNVFFITFLIELDPL